MRHTLLTTIDVSRLLDCSVELVRSLARSGRLPCERTLSGQRIYRPEDVKRLSLEREQAKQKRRVRPPRENSVKAGGTTRL